MTEDTQPPKFRMKFQVSGDKPFTFEFESDADEQGFYKIQEASKIRAGMLVYLKRLRELTQFNIPNGLQEHLPAHFFCPARVLIQICSDGILIRYDPQLQSNEDEAFIVPSQQSIKTAIPALSLGYIRVTGGKIDEVENDEMPIPPPPTVGFSITDASGVVTREFAAQQPVVIGIHLDSKEGTNGSESPEFSTHIQVRSRLEIGIEGSETRAHLKLDAGRQFEMRNAVKLQLYWDAMSILPAALPLVWRHADFRHVAERHFYESAFQAIKGQYLWLQGNSQARLRGHYKSVVDEFANLLNREDVAEEMLQTFLAKHPEVISPGYKRVIPKQPLGPYVTDFVIEDGAGEYLLVELESPSRRLFIQSGHEAADLTHARGQITDWIRYIQDNKPTVERELKLTGISASPRSMIVIGRSSNLGAENRRKLQVSSDRVEVCTYDDLLEKFTRTVETFVGLLSHVGQSYEVMYLPDEKI